ncbi:MAG: hypothetical protein PHP52_03960 [Bacteroidales bacterium]|jgi:hypothetical protein|nr:hypothetical protein [Bacteroidales bacterium]MDD4217542.1 hypothetical protein [Bacteroidales bacterium]MDY0142098.1 hypothetical protein [Bacteroidales bacterium]
MKNTIFILFTILPMIVICQGKIVTNNGKIIEAKIIKIGIKKIF